jgi:NADH-quinone oxidoreductase subunit L
MTKMGGLFPKMKITAITMLIGVLDIAGTPLFSGWYSKDAIIAQALGFVRMHPEHFLLLLLPLVTAAITTFYMFRMWFMTFTGRPRDHHVNEHAHESPWLMTVPLMILAFFTITVAWGWPVTDAESSLMGKHIHHAQHDAVIAEFGRIPHENEKIWQGGQAPPELVRERHYAFEYHSVAELMALLASILGVTFAALLYYFRVFDPAEAKEQFPAIHRFLHHKWYFDELYSAIAVRPAMAVAGWCRGFDTNVIDGIANFLGRFAVWVSKWDGLFDHYVIDGTVNVIGNVIYATGERLRHVQTGYIRSYILFLVLAAIGLFAALSYFVAMATAG